MHESSVATYEKNRNHIVEAKHVVQAILSHVHTGEQAPAASFLEVGSRLRKLGMHEDADALEASSEVQQVAALFKEFQEPASTGATGAASSEAAAAPAAPEIADPSGLVKHDEAQRIVDLVMHLLHRLEEAEKREEEQRKASADKYTAFAEKLQADVDAARKQQEVALEHKRAAQQAIAHAKASLEKHTAAQQEAAAAVADSQQSFDSAEAVCHAYRKEHETRSADRLADVETAKTIRTLVQQKFNRIEEQLQQYVQQVASATGSALADE